MEALQREVELLQTEHNLEKTISDVQKTIDLMVNARKFIAAGDALSPRARTRADKCVDAGAAPVTLAKLQNSVQQSFDRVNRDLKPVHQGLNNYQKAVTNVRPPALLLDQNTDVVCFRCSKTSRCQPPRTMRCRLIHP
jgi:hypothetical protein